jgi:hypothetical protein
MSQTSVKESTSSRSVPWSSPGVGDWGTAQYGMSGWNVSFAPALSGFSSGWLKFVNRRLQEDFALPQKLVACRDISEIWQTYGDFWNQAVDDYQEVTAEFARLCNTTGSIFHPGTKSSNLPSAIH